MPRLKRRPASPLSRSIDERRLRENFLIVCEGEKTEPNYFYGFRAPKYIEIIGTGTNTISIVEKAIELMEKSVYDQVWCVFDRDSFTKARFKAALQLAKNRSIKIAYSNEAFELWYLLHFNYYDSALSREEYGAKLLTSSLITKW